MIGEFLGELEKRFVESDFDIILVFGLDNVQYISCTPLHYSYSFPDRFLAIFWAKRREPICICPVEWEGSILAMGGIKRTVSYSDPPGDPNIIVQIVKRLLTNTGITTGRIGLDLSRVSLRLFKELESELNGFKLVSCDGWLKEIRMVKTPSELNLLEDIAFRTDHAIAGEAHHILVKQASTEMSITEDIRIHAIERGLDEIGHHSIAQATSGENATEFWPNPPMFGIGHARVPQLGELMRLELNGTLNGYWSSGARMLCMGKMSIAQKKAYDGLIALREVALEQIKHGSRCCEVYEAVKNAAEERSIELVEGLGVGHGIGSSVREAPYLNGADETTLRSGMVLVLNPVIRGPDDVLMLGKDTVVVEKNGARIIGWYKDWRAPFIANYTL
jgi:Xaa-Pro aminopeptidase